MGAYVDLLGDVKLSTSACEIAELPVSEGSERAAHAERPIANACAGQANSVCAFSASSSVPQYCVF